MPLFAQESLNEGVKKREVPATHFVPVTMLMTAALWGLFFVIGWVLLMKVDVERGRVAAGSAWPAAIAMPK